MTDGADSQPSADTRPRPQYGEYATPEEQRARISQPDVTDALEKGTSSPEAEIASPAAPANDSATVAAPAAAETVAPVKKRSVDRIVTFGLLTYGLITVVTSFGALVDYNGYAEQVLTMMGADASLAEGLDGRTWGMAAALVLAFGWLATAALSWWNLSKARISWWIPLVGGVVFNTVSAALMLTPLMSDPAIMNAMIGAVGS